MLKASKIILGHYGKAVMNLSLTWLNKTMLLYMLFKSAYGKMWPSIIPVFSQLSRPCGFHQLLLQNVVFAVQSLFEQLHNLWSLRQIVLRSRFNISTDRTVNNVDFYNSFNAQCVGYTSRWFILPNINILEELGKIKIMETRMESLEKETERLRTENTVMWCY